MSRVHSEDDSNVLRITVCNDVFAAEFDYNSGDLSQNKIRLWTQPQASSYIRDARSAFLAAAGGREGRWPERHSFVSGFAPDCCTCADYARSVSNLLRNFSFGTQRAANYNPLSSLCPDSTLRLETARSKYKCFDAQDVTHASRSFWQC